MARQTLVTCIYRARNAPVVAAMLAPAIAAGWDVRLWALDEVEETLAPRTVGSGGGSKFDLLNELTGPSEDAETGWVVVADDDVSFENRGLVEFVETAEEARFGLAQPAHRLRSNISHRITWARPVSRARMTSFVEIGPVFAVAPDWRSRIIPFPSGIGMGWGLELDWADLRKEGCRLGIVDSVRMNHLAPVGGTYGFEAAAQELAELLERRGVPQWRGVRRTLATWRPWQPEPPWLANGAV